MLVQSLEGAPVATLVPRDREVLRPHLVDVRSPGEVELTRRHPPRAGVDAADHATMHPGVWLAFGDLGGVDFWRNRGSVVCRSVLHIASGRGDVRLELESDYIDPEKRPVCRESCRLSFTSLPGGDLILYDSRFFPVERPVAFGDQEEMGLGLRMATPLAVSNGGEIVASHGGRNEKEVWGRPADWCAYQGVADGRRAGLLLVPDPANFRRSWMHARDYGLLVANPFGRRAFTRGEADSTPIPREGLRLRFGLLAYDRPESERIDLPSLAAGVLQALR